MKLNQISTAVSLSLISMFGQIELHNSQSSILPLSLRFNQAFANCRQTSTGVACTQPSPGGTQPIGNFDGWWETDFWDSQDNNEYDGGGSSSSGDSSAPNTLEFTHDDISDFVTAAIQIKNGLNELLAKPGLNSTQIAKLTKILNGLNTIISAANSSQKTFIDLINGNLTDAVQEAIGFLVGYAVGLGLASVNAPVLAVVIVGIGASIAFTHSANAMRTTVNNLYEEFQENVGTPNDWNCYITNIPLVCGRGAIPPIILDMDNDGIELSGYDTSIARMDIDNDGFDEHITWVDPDDAIFVIDHNGSGTIDDTREFSFASFKGKGASDLEGLQTFDTNNDGIFDIQDDAFAYSGIWHDRNGNAKYDDGEFTYSDVAKLQSISLTGDRRFKTESDSVIVSQMQYSITNSSGTTESFTAGDVLFYGKYSSGTRLIYEDIDFTVLENEQKEFALDATSSIKDNALTLGKSQIGGLSLFNTIRLGRGNDQLDATLSGPVKVSSGKGNDLILGSQHRDIIRGGGGHDEIRGKEGNDKISGQRGNDIIDGGLGNDSLKGGKGNDIFIISQGHDSILDFNLSEDYMHSSDLSDFKGLPYSSQNKGTTVHFGENQSIFFKGISVLELQEVKFK